MIKFSLMDTLGKRIARYRKAAGLSQASLAMACGWKSQSRVGNYESDTREPTLADLEKIASAVGVSVARLTYGEGGPRLATEIADIARGVVSSAPPHTERAAPDADSSAGASAQSTQGTSFTEPQVARLIAKAFSDGLLKGDDLDEIARMARHLIRKNAASAAVAIPEHLEGLAEAAIRTAEAGESPTDMLKMLGHGMKKSHAKEDPQTDARPSKKRNS